MLTSDPRDLVRLLNGPTLIHRTGLWLVSLSLLGHEEDAGARLNLSAVDFRARVLARVPPGSRFAGLSSTRVLELLASIAQEEALSTSVLVYNLDLALSRLSQDECQNVWQRLFRAFPHMKRALLLTMPQTASALLPGPSELRQWAQDSRLVADNNLQFGD